MDKEYAYIPPEFFQDMGLYSEIRLGYEDQNPNRVDLGPGGYGAPPIYLTAPPIRMVCKTCKLEQTFRFGNEEEGIPQLFGPIVREHITIKHLTYYCQACHQFDIHFLVKFDHPNNTVVKVGQEPGLEVRLANQLSKALGADEVFFRKGRLCEINGFGIAAYAYYRRVFENKLDQILDDIEFLVPKENLETYQAKVKEARAKREIAAKIETVAPYLPVELLVMGNNPLTQLYQALSSGLHGKSDEQCLNEAGVVRFVLTMVLRRIVERKEEVREYEKLLKGM